MRTSISLTVISIGQGVPYLAGWKSMLFSEDVKKFSVISGVLEVSLIRINLSLQTPASVPQAYNIFVSRIKS